MSEVATKARRAPTTIVRIEPALVRVGDAAAMWGGVAISTFYDYVAKGIAPRPRQSGGSAMWSVDEIKAAAHALPVSEIRPPPRGGE